MSEVRYDRIQTIHTPLTLITFTVMGLVRLHTQSTPGALGTTTHCYEVAAEDDPEIGEVQGTNGWLGELVGTDDSVLLQP